MTEKLINELIVKNGVLHANREIESEGINGVRNLILYYRGCGYKMTTIRYIVKTKFEVTDRKIKNIVTNYVKTVGIPFRPYSDDKKEWNRYYKDQTIKNLGKAHDPTKEYSINQPLTGGDHRKFNGVTKTENQLLREIRIG